jgi:DNA phosphorothioation-dependent restriction protein DptG
MDYIARGNKSYLIPNRCKLVRRYNFLYAAQETVDEMNLRSPALPNRIIIMKITERKRVIGDNSN